MEPNLHDLTGDQLESELIRIEQAIARLRRLQTHLISEADRRQQPLADGCRTLVDWVASRLDVTHRTARDLITLTRSQETEGLEGWSFDRQVALTHLQHTRTEPVDPHEMARFDLAGIRRLTAHHRRVGRHHEEEVTTDRYVALQPSLDLTRWRLWGLLTATDGATLEQALTERADQLPPPPDGITMTRGQKQADALTALALDSLTHTTPDETPGSGGTVTIVCDARDATPTNGETGVTVVGGPRVGPHALEEILCDGTIELIALTPDGTPLGVGQTSSTLPPRIRRFVLARDGACTIDGCQSRYRLQPHHIQHKAWGGDHDTGNLTTLCWFHHHRIIHGHGYRIDPDSPPTRRRLTPPSNGPP